MPPTIIFTENFDMPRDPSESYKKGELANKNARSMEFLESLGAQFRIATPAEITAANKPSKETQQAAAVAPADPTPGSEPPEGANDEKKVWCIIAGGPSLTAEDCEKIRAAKIPTLGINNAYQIAPWVDAIYGCDCVWWDKYYADVKKHYAGKLYTSDPNAAKLHKLRYIDYIQDDKQPEGLSETGLVSGHNGGYQAANLVYIWGARTVFYLGLDLKYKKKKETDAQGNTKEVTLKHWHGNHPSPLGNCESLDLYIKTFRRMHPERYGVTIVNCSPDTAVDCFPRMPIDEAINQYWRT